MGKYWFGEKSIVHVRGRGNCKDDADFVADDFVYFAPIGIFFLDGEVVYRYNGQTQYWYSEIVWAYSRTNVSQ